MLKLLSPVIGFCLFANTANAYEVMQICAKPLEADKGYKVEAIIAYGTELNSAWNTSSLRASSKYVVIYWADSQVSVIELDHGIGPGLMAIKGSDRRGYRWEVSTSVFC